jgi:hypothetical protein
MKSVNKQLTLKPQDVIVALKLRLLNGEPSTFAALSHALALSASEIHASFNRAQLARLVTPQEGAAEVNRPGLIEFLIYGLSYAFPPVMGAPTRGLLTGYGMEPLRSTIVHAEEAPVWPFAKGDARGPALYPLYPTVPIAALRDRSLYEVLALIDSLRIGAARERDIAVKLLIERLA